MKKRLIIFMPSVEGGGVEKNFFIISNYLSTKFSDVTLITISKLHKNKVNKMHFVLNLDIKSLTVSRGF